MPLLPRVSPGSRRLLGALVLTAGWCGTLPPPAAAEPSWSSPEDRPVEERPAEVEAPERRESGGRGGLVAPIRGAFGFGQAGARFGASREGRSHEGQDLIAACGTRVVAASAGVVSRSASHPLAGNYVVVDGAAGDHAYMHLQARSPLRVGARVRTGQVLGAVGTTGNARGCHLHFELWTEPGYRRGGRPIDPLPFLRGGRGG